MVLSTQILRSTVIIFVYDITNQESFNSLQFWLKTVRDALKEKVFYGVVVANKTDLNDRIVVRPQDGASFARSNKLEFVETSAVSAI
jgi:GTPase SAR1 family protein